MEDDGFRVDEVVPVNGILVFPGKVEFPDPEDRTFQVSALDYPEVVSANNRICVFVGRVLVELPDGTYEAGLYVPHFGKRKTDSSNVDLN